MTLGILAGRVRWQEWGPEAFARAQAEGKPVLLSISAVWCHWCHVMDRTTYSDPAIAARINAAYIPVRVDTDLRPDINERYNQGGWPSTAFLTPEGYVIHGATFLPPEQMRAVVDELATYYDENRAEIGQKIAAALAEERQRRGGLGGTAVPESNAADVTLDRMERQYDARHGGFGYGAKFPHPEAIDLLITRYWGSRDPFWQEMARRTLDGMAQRGLHDHVAGGFFRYSTDRAWQTPHYEKLAETNAALIRPYLHAAQAFAVPEYAATARATIHYLLTTLLDPQGGFRGSQDADETYYRQDAAGRAAIAPPPVDPRIYTASNAQAASALLLAATLFTDDPQRDEYRTTALATLDRLLADAQDADGGLFHVLAPDGVRAEKGLLADQVATARAALDAYAHTGDGDYREAARRIAAWMLRHLLAETGFRDRPEEPDAVGLLANPVYNLAENGLAADLFLRLGWLTGEEAYQAIALRLLAGFGQAYEPQGVFAATYALSWEKAHSAPRHIVIVGPPDDPDAAAMRAVACAAYHPWSLVEPLDPARDAARIATLGFPADTVRAYPCTGNVCRAPADDAAALERVLSAEC